MSTDERLRGACSCGRYKYIIDIPSDIEARQTAQIHFGNSGDDRRSQASLLSAWLKVPLTWYQSLTVAFLPDESHESIARTFTPQSEPGCQRKFCGYCGTHISYWTEQPTSEQDFMHITLGSLRDKDILALEDLELLPGDIDHEDILDVSADPSKGLSTNSMRDILPTSTNNGTVQTSRSGTTNGISWFEDMIEGSRLGQHSKRRRGHGVSADGNTVVQWEVSEYFEGEEASESTSTRSKRKAADIATDDTAMEDS